MHSMSDLLLCSLWPRLTAMCRSSSGDGESCLSHAHDSDRQKVVVVVQSKGFMRCQGNEWEHLLEVRWRRWHVTLTRVQKAVTAAVMYHTTCLTTGERPLCLETSAREQPSDAGIRYLIKLYCLHLSEVSLKFMSAWQARAKDSRLPGEKALLLNTFQRKGSTVGK